MSDLKTTFIIRCLSRYMTDVEAAMRIAADRAGVGITGEAINSLAFSVVEQGDGAVANLSFENVLRFVDMGVGRAHPLGGLKSVKVTLQSQNRTGLIQVKDKSRKAKKIYSRIAYGRLTYLENQLLYGYTEEAISALKQELSEQKTL